MESIDRDGDSGVLDHTEQFYSEENRHKIRISNGINLRELNVDGIVFQPEIDERFDGDKEEDKTYFANHAEELEKLLKERKMEEVGESVDANDDLTEFEVLKKSMEDVES